MPFETSALRYNPPASPLTQNNYMQNYIDAPSTLQLGLPALPDAAPEPAALFAESAIPTDAMQDADKGVQKQPTQLLQDLHRLLLETTIVTGKLVCGNCGHEYAIKEGIANFLLPSHLV